MTAKRAAQSAKAGEALHHAFLIEALLEAYERAEKDHKKEAFIILIKEHFPPIIENLAELEDTI